MPKLRRHEHDGHVYHMFKCPCGDTHTVRTFAPPEVLAAEPKTVVWEFNGDVEQPTITPSIRVRYTPFKGPEKMCHLHVTAGVAEFCSDCTHEHAGKKLPLPDYPEAHN